MNKSDTWIEQTAVFEKMIDRGNNNGFLKAIDKVNKRSFIWDALQLRSIELYMDQGLTEKAFEKASVLKNTLTNPLYRKQAEILYLFLTLILNGRRTEDAKALKQACDKVNADAKNESLKLLVQSINLKLQADSLITGQVAVEKKRDLISRYQAHIENCLTQKEDQKAFSSLMEICQMLLSKPLPDSKECLNYLNAYKSRAFIKTAAHRQASIYLLMAEVVLEMSLQGQTQKSPDHYYQLASDAYTLSNHKFVNELVKKSYGTLLLKYGKSKGKRILDQALQGLEKQAEHSQCLSIYATQIEWLEYKGDKSALNSYLIRANEIQETTSLGNLPFQLIENHNESLASLSCQIISRTYPLKWSGNTSEAIQLTQRSLPKFQAIGDTFYLARVLAHLSELPDSPADPLSLSTSQQAIALYTRLGYAPEALEILKHRLTQWAQLNQVSKISKQKIEQVRKEILQIDSILKNRGDLKSQRALISCYQAAASFLMNFNTDDAKRYLMKAESIIKGYGLTPLLALNTFYFGCLTIEIFNQHKRKNSLAVANTYFQEAHSLFKLISHHEGMWRSLFGQGLCAYQKLTTSQGRSTILIETETKALINAVQMVKQLTLSQVKTHACFGAPVYFNYQLQTDAQSLFNTTLGLFKATTTDSKTIFRLIDLRSDWEFLNQNQPELKPN